MKIIVPNETACCNYSKVQKWLSFCGACLLSRNSGLVYCEVTEKPVQDAIFEGDFLPLRRFFVLEFSSVFFSCIVFSIVFLPRDIRAFQASFGPEKTEKLFDNVGVFVLFYTFVTG